MKTIRVTGKGQTQVHPDMTRITMTLKGTHREYSETLRRSSEDTEKLKDLLTQFGFERSDLKTLDFSVDTEYTSYRDSKGDYQRRFDGYKFTHSLKVEFDSDNGRLGRILYALAHFPAKPEISISYTVKDPEAVRNTLLGNAVKDATEKAAVLSKAADISLGGIQSIDYSWGRIDLEVCPADALMMKECASPGSCESYDPDIEPDDIRVSDTVTVIWEIA